MIAFKQLNVLGCKKVQGSPEREWWGIKPDRRGNELHQQAQGGRLALDAGCLSEEGCSQITTEWSYRQHQQYEGSNKS